MPMAQRVILFDVNETLLDLNALDQPFERIFGERSARADWFKQLLQLSLLTNVLDAYADFSELARAALEMVAEQRNIAVSHDQMREVAQAMRALPAHEDVPVGLARLHDAGFRLAALTNSASEAAEAQLRFAGIRDAFEAVFSVDLVRRFKPAPETYQMAAERLGVALPQIRLVAAHGWDVWGALQAGAAAAFIARPGQVLIPFTTPPDIVGPSLPAVAEMIVAADAS
jgi:2-haloacid dehalogenase